MGELGKDNPASDTPSSYEQSATISMDNKDEVKKNSKLRLTLAYRPFEIEEAMALVQETHGRSRFKESPFSIQKTGRHLSKALMQPETYSLAIARTGDGRPVGFTFLSVGELYICDEDTFVTVEGLYVGMEYRKSLIGGKAAKMLIDGIKMFARNHGAKGIFIYGTMGVEDENLGKLMQKSGFELLGRNWIG